MSSILEEFDADRYEEDLKQIYREEGIEIGIEKGLEKGLKQGREAMFEDVEFAVNMFREGKSDEEVFQTKRFSSIEQVARIRNMWKVMSSQKS